MRKHLRNVPLALVLCCIGSSWAAAQTAASADGERTQRVLFVERSMLDQMDKLNKQIERDPKASRLA